MNRQTAMPNKTPALSSTCRASRLCATSLEKPSSAHRLIVRRLRTCSQTDRLSVAKKLPPKPAEIIAMPLPIAPAWKKFFEKTVLVYDTRTGRLGTADPLREQTSWPMVALSGDHVYCLGGEGGSRLWHPATLQIGRVREP